MKFKINQDHFSNGLQQVLNVVGSRATMPILSNVLIEAVEGHISLTTTNLDLGIRCRIKADVSEPGGITSQDHFRWLELQNYGYQHGGISTAANI